MEIKIDIIGDESELTAFLHGLTINHSQKQETPVKTANTKKKRPPEESGGTGTAGRHPGRSGNGRHRRKDFRGR